MKVETTSISEPMSGADRRRSPRYRLSGPITVEVKDGPPIPAMTIEISATGLSAILSTAINVGDIVNLHPIAGGTVSGQAKHNMGKVYGFQFLGLTEEQSQKIVEDCRHLPIYNPKHLGI